MREPLPKGAQQLAGSHPGVWEAYEVLGRVCSEAGPLDARTRRLVKLALAIGAGAEGAVHSHARRAVEEGIPPAELEHVAVLAVPTLGLPRAVAALTWIRDIRADRSAA